MFVKLVTDTGAVPDNSDRTESVYDDPAVAAGRAVEYVERGTEVDESMARANAWIGDGLHLEMTRA